MKISVLNESTMIPSRDFMRMVKACAIQLSRDACPVWGCSKSSVVAAGSLKGADGYIISIMDDADQADALGYHSETPDGRPYGKVFVKPTMDNGGTLTDGPSSVSCTLSHEVLEMWWDPQVNVWYEAADGTLWSGELCDPVEASSYEIVVGKSKVTVSNFVLPPYFDARPEKGSKFDFLGRLKKEFTLEAGGYAVLRGPRGGTKQVFGKKYPEWKLAGKKFPASRTAKRK